MQETNHIICVDWGTTSLRLFLVERATRHISARLNSDEGVLGTHNAWKNQGGERERHFLEVLHRHIQRLGTKKAQPLEGMPVVLSGMASSSIGLRELPYGDLPQPLAACRLPFHRLEAGPDFPHPILLISGLRKSADVMRGEEVQAMGLDPSLREGRRRITFILPGTHSKHLCIKDQTIVGFKTFMTGELFALLSRHSILAKSLEVAAGQDLLLGKPFEEGVRLGARGILSHTLFSLRARQLEGSLRPEEGASYLSGLLIGHELASLRTDPEEGIILSAASALQQPYQQAIHLLGKANALRMLTTPESEALLVNGQLHILEQCQSG